MSQQVIDRLTQDGWNLSYVVKDEGGYKKDSVFAVTITRNGVSYTTEYRKGWGLRTWKTGQGLYGDNARYWERYRKAGQRVNVHFNILADSPLATTFNSLTKAEPPTIDEVMYSLWSDTMYVSNGETFEDFCSQTGDDTDSRQAEKIYKGCQEEWHALIRLGANLDTLASIFQDY